MNPSEKIAPETANEPQTKPLEEFSLRRAAFPTPNHLIAFLDLLVGGAFGKVTRAKGLFPCGSLGEWLRFDVVGREWAITGFPPTDGEAMVVFIGEKIARPAIREILYWSGNRIPFRVAAKP